MATYNLLGEVLETSKARDNYVDISKKVSEALSKYVPEFNEKMEAYSSLQSMAYNIGSDMNSVFTKSVKHVMTVFYQNGVYDIDEATFVSTYLDNDDCKGLLADAADRVRSYYDDIIEEGDTEKAIRAYNKANRSRWEGGGFGVAGAIKGAATAGMLNAGSGAMYSIANAIGNASTDRKTKQKLAAAMENEEMFTFCMKAVYGAISAIKDGLVEALEDSSDMVFEEISESDEIRAENVISAIEQKKVPKEKVKEQILKAWELNPFNEDVYQLMLREYGDSDNGVEETGSAFSVAVHEMKEYHVLEWVKSKVEDIGKNTDTGVLETKYKKLQKDVSGMIKKYGMSDHVGTYTTIQTLLDELANTVQILNEINTVASSYNEKTEEELKVLSEKLATYPKQYAEKLAEEVKQCYEKKRLTREISEVKELVAGYENKNEQELETLVKELEGYSKNVCKDERKEVKKTYEKIVNKRQTEEVSNLIVGYEEKSEEELKNLLNRLSTYPEKIATEKRKKVKELYDSLACGRASVEIKDLVQGYEAMSEDELKSLLEKLEDYPQEAEAETRSAVEMKYNILSTTRMEAEVNSLTKGYAKKSKEELEVLVDALENYPENIAPELRVKVYEKYEGIFRPNKFVSLIMWGVAGFYLLLGLVVLKEMLISGIGTIVAGIVMCPKVEMKMGFFKRLGISILLFVVSSLFA